MLELRQAQITDIKALATLRERDRIDGLEEVLCYGIKTSVEAWTAFDTGNAVCIWGIHAQSAFGGAFIWMLPTLWVDSHPIQFLRASRRLVQNAVERYGIVYGYVVPDFALSCRWMEWLGFRAIQEGVLLRYELRAE